MRRGGYWISEPQVSTIPACYLSQARGSGGGRLRARWPPRPAAAEQPLPLPTRVPTHRPCPPWPCGRFPLCHPRVPSIRLAAPVPPSAPSVPPGLTRTLCLADTLAPQLLTSVSTPVAFPVALPVPHSVSLSHHPSLILCFCVCVCLFSCLSVSVSLPVCLCVSFSLSLCLFLSLWRSISPLSLSLSFPLSLVWSRLVSATRTNLPQPTPPEQGGQSS